MTLAKGARAEAHKVPATTPENAPIKGAADAWRLMRWCQVVDRIELFLLILLLLLSLSKIPIVSHSRGAGRLLNTGGILFVFPPVSTSTFEGALPFVAPECDVIIDSFCREIERSRVAPFFEKEKESVCVCIW